MVTQLKSSEPGILSQGVWVQNPVPRFSVALLIRSPVCHVLLFINIVIIYIYNYLFYLLLLPTEEEHSPGGSQIHYCFEN